jgi:hypothetical protein
MVQIPGSVPQSETQSVNDSALTRSVVERPTIEVMSLDQVCDDLNDQEEPNDEEEECKDGIQALPSRATSMQMSELVRN